MGLPVLSWRELRPLIAVFVTATALHLSYFVGEGIAQIVPASGNSSFSTESLTFQENDSLLHNTVNDQCCFERLDGSPVDRGLTPILDGLVEFQAGFQEDGVDFRGQDSVTHRGCIRSTCFSIPEIPVGADTQFGNGVSSGSSDTTLQVALPSSLTVTEALMATNGSNSSAPFPVHFSVTHNIDPLTRENLVILDSRPEKGTKNRLNTINFGFAQSGQSGVPGGTRGGPVAILNGDRRDSGEATGCKFCGSQGERVSRQQDFEMLFTIDSRTDPDGNMLGPATGTFSQTLRIGDVLAPNTTASCGSAGCIEEMGPITIQGSFTFDGTLVQIKTENVEINGLPQPVGGKDPLGIPSDQSINVSPPTP